MRRRLFVALEPLWRTVDGDGGGASPYRRLLRPSAERWRRARLADRGERRRARPARPDRSRRSLHGDPRDLAGASSAPSALEPWDYWYAIGAAARRPRCRGSRPRPSARPRPSLPGGARRRPGRARDRVRRRCPVRAVRRSPSRSRSRWAPGLAASRRRDLDASAAMGLRDVRGRAASATSPSCSTRAAMPSTWPRSGRGPASSNSRWRHRLPRGRPPTSSAGTSTSPPGRRTGWGRPPTPRDAARSTDTARSMLDICWALFEIELHRHPERRPNDVWAEITRRRARRRPASRVVLVGHPWPAHRQAGLPGQLRAVGDHRGRGPREDPASSAGRGSTGDPGWYRFIAEALFAPGRRDRRRTCSRHSSAAR